MLIRVFYKGQYYDHSLKPGEKFSVGSGKKDELALADTDLKKSHVVLEPGRECWRLVCNGPVYLQNRLADSEEVRFQESYLLSEKDRISLICADDENIQSHSVKLNGQNEITIGRDPENQVRFLNPQVSKHHARLWKENDIWFVEDLQSTNGTYVDRKSVQRTQLKNGDILAIGMYTMIFRENELEVRYTGASAIFSAEKVAQEELTEDCRFVRSPRIQMQLPDGTIKIDAPPSLGGKPEINLLSVLLPVLGTVGVSVMFAVVMQSTRMLFYTLPMTLIGLITSISNYRRQVNKYNRQQKLRLEKYTEYLEKTEETIRGKYEDQRKAMEAADPKLEDCLRMAGERNRRLWDRRPIDEDFLSVRIGTGTVEAAFRIEAPQKGVTLEEDELECRPEQMKRRYQQVREVPLVYNIRQNQVCGIVGPAQQRYQLLKNLVAQLTTHHCYTEVRLVVVYNEKEQEQFRWMRELPHTWDTVRQVSFMASGKEAAKQLFQDMTEVFKARRLENGEESFGSAPMALPYYLFVIAEPSFLTRKDPITEYLFQNPQLGAGVILAVDQIVQLPKECGLILEVGPEKNRIYRQENLSAAREFRLEEAQHADFCTFAASMGHIRCDEEFARNEPPRYYTLFDMLGVRSAEELDVEKCWNQSNALHSLRVPLGIGDGKQITMDIHHAADGAHGLIAGTTGSGKSELLQSYMAALAMHFPPSEMCFVVIDYKGGGLANQLEKLPHIRGVITNLAGRETDRFLAALDAELIKRQRLFAEVKETSVKSITQYLALYRQGKVTEPLPHLLLIVDEFAELKQNQPDFMEKLISVSRIGRSLGIHLILSTQKPAGQVSEQIWSNSHFRICLKVASREDSSQMLHSPAAFSIKNPGRAYLQVGNNEVFELFQSAYGGEKLGSGASAITQLDAVVGRIAGYCAEKGICRLPEICPPPLPDRLEFRKLPEDRTSAGIRIGRYDDPANQLQEEVTINFMEENLAVFGAPQTGKTNILQTILRSACESRSSDQIQFYLVDFGSMILKNFERLDHVGGVVLSHEDEKLENLFKLLTEEIERRKEIFLKRGVSSFASFREAGETSLPQLVLMIDNLTALQALYPDSEEILRHLCQEGLSVGISIVFANAHTSGIGYKYMENFSRKIALYCNDKSEYSDLFDYTKIVLENQPGRGVVNVDHRLLETQFYLSFSGKREIDRVEQIREFVISCNSANSGQPAPRIPVVPEYVTRQSLEEEGYQPEAVGYQVPLGVDYETMELYNLDLLRQGIAVITGGEQSGKTNLTMHILRSVQRRIFENDSQIYVADETGDLQEASEFGSVERYVRTESEASALVETVCEALENRKREWSQEKADSLPLLLLVLSGGDLLSTLLGDSGTARALMELVRDARKYRVFVLLSELEDEEIRYSSPDVLKYVKENSCILALQNIGEIRILEIPGRFIKKFGKNIRVGDGFSFLGGKVRKLRFVLDCGKQEEGK